MGKKLSGIAISKKANKLENDCNNPNKTCQHAGNWKNDVWKKTEK